MWKISENFSSFKTLGREWILLPGLSPVGPVCVVLTLKWMSRAPPPPGPAPAEACQANSSEIQSTDGRVLAGSRHQLREGSDKWQFKLYKFNWEMKLYFCFWTFPSERRFKLALELQNTKTWSTRWDATWHTVVDSIVLQSRIERISLLKWADSWYHGSWSDWSVHSQPVERFLYRQQKLTTELMCSVSALGCKVLGLVKKERIPTEQDSVAQYFTNLELPQLLSSVDYLINILPSTPDTDNILSKLVCVLLPSDRHQIPLCQSNKSVFFSHFLFERKL